MSYSKYLIISVLFFSLFIFTSFIYGQSYDQGENVVLPEDKIVNEDYFAAGESVTIHGTVNGDVYAAGGSVLVDGTVNGDLLVAGGSINIGGTVTGDIRAAGGQINVLGAVDGSITAAGGSVTIAQGASVGKSVVIGTGQLSLLAPVQGGATIGAGNVVIGNKIGGNVLAGVGQMTLTPEALIGGNLTYYADEESTLPTEAVAGKVSYQKPPVDREELERNKEEAESFLEAASFGMKLYSALVAFILGSLFVYLFPRFMEKSTEVLDKSPFTTMIVGLLALIGFPVLFVVLLITILGIPIAFMLLAIYLIYLYLAKIFVAMYVGKKIVNWGNWKKSQLLYLLIGLVVWVIAASLPVVGWLVQLVVLITGLGMMILVKKYSFQELKAKKLV